MESQPNFADFTEDAYRELLRLAAHYWLCLDFREYNQAGRVCLWRHDVDFSIHRAHRLAHIEAEEGVKATYFVLLHSVFYNALEPVIARKIEEILQLGHFLGLHFDASFYGHRIQNQDDLAEYLQLEQTLLYKTFGYKPQVFSFHNPDMGPWLQYDQNEIGGLINTYGRYFRDHYSYVSDSNGYWRFRRLYDVLQKAEEPKLHVLTHPEWWVPQAMSPRDRISRCIDGRSAYQHDYYDEVLRVAGRTNVGKKDQS